MFVEPLRDRSVFVVIQLQLNRFQRIHVQQVVRIIKWRLFIVERGETHALEVPPVPLLAPHHDPHRAPLRDVNGFHYLRCFVHESNRTGDVVNNLAVPRLFPGHGHVLQQLENSVRHEFQSAEIHALVVSEFLTTHVAVVLNDLAHVLLVEVGVDRMEGERMELKGLEVRFDGNGCLIGSTVLHGQCRKRE